MRNYILIMLILLNCHLVLAQPDTTGNHHGAIKIRKKEKPVTPIKEVSLSWMSETSEIMTMEGAIEIDDTGRVESCIIVLESGDLEIGDVLNYLLDNIHYPNDEYKTYPDRFEIKLKGLLSDGNKLTGVDCEYKELIEKYREPLLKALLLADFSKFPYKYGRLTIKMEISK